MAANQSESVQAVIRLPKGEFETFQSVQSLLVWTTTKMEQIPPWFKLTRVQGYEEEIYEADFALLPGMRLDFDSAIRVLSVDFQNTGFDLKLWGDKTYPELWFDAGKETLSVYNILSSCKLEMEAHINVGRFGDM